MDRLTWFKRAGYGLFVHFGLYSMLGGVYKGTPSPRNAEWIMRHLQIPVAEYKKLAEKFDPAALDPTDIVRRAKAWGMQYVVVTAKHHDGFALYDSKVSDYNVMHTPHGKDIIRAFAEACAKEKMPFGIYYSQMQDWEHPDGNGNTWDFEPAGQDFSKYFYGKCLPQVKELLTNYGDLCLLWFDTPYDMPKPLCEELAREVKALQPNCLINGRIGYNLGDYRQMADNSIPRNHYDGAFEVPMMVKRSIVYPVNGEAPSAVIAFGVILRGSTAHADLIGTAITNQLMSISCDSLIPVVHEVLLLNNEEQAFARCIASSLNRGREAARAAIAMLNLLEEQQSEARSAVRRSSVSRTGSLI